MQTEVIVSIISLVGMVVVALVGYAGARTANNESKALFAYRLDQLEEKMDRHNNLVERITRVEAEVKSLRDRKPPNA